MSQTHRWLSLAMSATRRHRLRARLLNRRCVCGPRRAGLATLIVCLIASPALAAPPPELRAPLWHWHWSAGIEWVAAIGVEAPLLLAATRDARLHLVDLATGHDLLRQPIGARPGVRPAWTNSSAALWSTSQPTSPAAGSGHDAAQPPDTAYCFDRFSAYAIQLTPVAALRWKAGTWREGLGEGSGGGPEPAGMFQGDPEELRRTVAAHATAWGVLVARDDGLVGLLDRADGHVRWVREFPPLASVRMHVRGRTAALVWKEGRRVTGAFVDVATGRRADFARPNNEQWPIWSTLTEHGLVLVHPDRIDVCNPERPARSLALGGSSAVLAAAVALHVERPAGPETGPRARLIFGSGAGQLRAVDLQTGATAWTVAERSGGSRYWSSLRVHGDVASAATRQSATLYDATTGELRGRFSADPGTRLLDVGLTSRAAWFLTTDEQADEPCLWLAGLRLPHGGEPARPPSAGATGPRSRLGQTGVFLRAIWTERRVVVASRSGLRAYTLR